MTFFPLPLARYSAWSARASSSTWSSAPLYHAVAHGQLAVAHRLQLLYGLAQARCHVQRFAQGGLRQHDDELVTPPTRQQVKITQAAAQVFRHLHQCPVTLRVAIAVVDRLEIIHVHGNQRQRLAKALSALTLQLQLLFQPVATGDAGQGIAFGQLAVFIQLALQLLVDPGQFAGAFGNQALQ